MLIKIFVLFLRKLIMSGIVKELNLYFKALGINYERAKIIGDNNGYVIYETKNYLIKVKNINVVDLLQSNKDVFACLKNSHF